MSQKLAAIFKIANHALMRRLMARFFISGKKKHILDIIIIIPYSFKFGSLNCEADKDDVS